jgi:hypothetical protein
MFESDHRLRKTAGAIIVKSKLVFRNLDGGNEVQVRRGVSLVSVGSSLH